MNTVAMEQRKRIHPHKFTLWVGIGSIIMMFGGFTSAYIVRRNMANWTEVDLPKFFWYSTVVIILSSITLVLAKRNFREKQMANYRKLLVATIILGALFIVLQWLGFDEFIKNGLALGKSRSVDYLYVIIGVHALHIFGGIVGLIIMVAKAFNRKVKSYDIVPVEVMATYWHFVDLLWIYLLIFLIAVR